jgi:hypothetical protein
MLTKEKSRQKRKGVNNQNNSIELFPVLNTFGYDDDESLIIQLRKDQ